MLPHVVQRNQLFQKCINSHRFQMYYSSKWLKIFTFLKNLFFYYVFIGVHQVFVGAQGIFAVLCRISWVAGRILVVALQLSSCGIEAQLPFGVRDFSSPISDWTPNPTAQGGFLTTGPPGKSLKISFLKTEITCLICGVTSMYNWVHLPSHTVTSAGFRHTQPGHKAFLHTSTGSIHSHQNSGLHVSKGWL